MWASVRRRLCCCYCCCHRRCSWSVWFLFCCVRMEIFVLMLYETKQTSKPTLRDWQTSQCKPLLRKPRLWSLEFTWILTENTILVDNKTWHKSYIHNSYLQTNYYLLCNQILIYYFMYILFYSKEGISSLRTTLFRLFFNLAQNTSSEQSVTENNHNSCTTPIHLHFIRARMKIATGHLWYF